MFGKASTLATFVLLVAAYPGTCHFGAAQEQRRQVPSSPAGSCSSSPASRISDRALDIHEAAPQQRFRRRPANGVYKARIVPHWFAGGAQFWYRNDLRDETKEFIRVEADNGLRLPAFDHARLAESLSAATGSDYEANRLPFDEILLSEDGTTVHFLVQDVVWRCDLETYSCRPAADGVDLREESAERGSDRPASEGNRGRRRRRSGQPRFSPDGNWIALIREGNVFVGSRDGDEFQLSSDGTRDLSYGLLEWSPDSRTLVAFRIEPGDREEVYLVESSPRDGGRAVLHRRAYALPGDKFTFYELNLFSMEDRSQFKPQVDRIELGFGRPRIQWNRDGSHLRYELVDRGHQRFRVIDVDARTGETVNVIDETTTTFIWTAHTENVRLRRANWLEESDELIYASERDGWRHLYLIDATNGVVKHQITHGEYVVRGIDRIDEQARQIWFHASGKHSEQDPYFIHFYRIDFDGKNLVELTRGSGNHEVQYSPDRKYLIDTYSRVDQPPIHELRRAADGGFVCRLDEADITQLRESGWAPLEVFVAKGRDGQTDIWGVICRPRDFDPAKKYPVIESIYAGPQGSFVPKSFRGVNRYSSLADLGFIVVQMDGMGTANRSKAFHDVCWHNLKDAGFPDRILWIKAAAARYPSMDLSRVGIYGNSAGGQNAMGALLFHPDFYKVAVSSCGCHDNRMDKASWNEQWMGYPVGPQYSASSNIDNAHRLLGKVLLIVGEMDTNVPPESTMRLADALIDAGKDFDLLVIPGGGHGMGGAYGARRMRDFFVRHLQGVAPPDRNRQGD